MVSEYAAHMPDADQIADYAQQWTTRRLKRLVPPVMLVPRTDSAKYDEAQAHWQVTVDIPGVGEANRDRVTSALELGALADWPLDDEPAHAMTTGAYAMSTEGTLSFHLIVDAPANWLPKLPPT